MKWINLISLAVFVWLLQVILSDFLSINTVRPDFCVIFILYLSLVYGRTIGICAGFLFGLIIDLSGSGIFFGLFPLSYTITGYLAGWLYDYRSRLNSFYFSLSWVTILFFQFFIYCSVQYQDLWVLDRQIFWGKWLGTAIYTLSFVGILQFIYPISKLNSAESR